jgi:hypothetical protein
MPSVLLLVQGSPELFQQVKQRRIIHEAGESALEDARCTKDRVQLDTGQLIKQAPLGPAPQQSVALELEHIEDVVAEASEQHNE